MNILFVLLVNAVPLYGVTVLGWSAGTVLMLYWLENLLVAMFTCARIALHRKLTRKRGHWRAGQLGRFGGRSDGPGLLGEYASLAILFTLVHGVFVAVVVFMVGVDRPDVVGWKFSGEQFLVGALQMLAVLSLDFLVDAARMRSRSFAWIKAYARQRTGRVLILHLAIVFGMFGMVASDSPLVILYVLIGLKTLWNLAASNAGAKPDTLPPEPPAWALEVANTIVADAGGAAALQADWKRSIDDARRAAVEDEEVMPAR